MLSIRLRFRFAARQFATNVSLSIRGRRAGDNRVHFSRQHERSWPNPSLPSMNVRRLTPGAGFPACLHLSDTTFFDGDRRTHDAYAHGDTTLLCVSRGDFKNILSQHVELYEALLRLHARRIRQLYGLVEDMNTLPLRARLAKQLVHLVRTYGVPVAGDGAEMRIGLHLAQEELAQLLGASRQRVNQELKTMEREDTIRIESAGVIIRDHPALLRIIDASP